MPTTPARDVDKLHAIAVIEEQLAHLTHDRRNTQRRQDNRVQAARAADEALARHDADEAASRATEAELNTKIRHFEQQRDRARRALELGAGADAAERQLATCLEQLDLLETEILEHLDAHEALVALRPPLVATAEQAHATVADHAEPTVAALAQLDAALAAGRHARTEAIADLPDDLRSRHDRILATKPTAVTFHRNRSCAACNQSVPLAKGADLARGLVISCQGCGRFLVDP